MIDTTFKCSVCGEKYPYTKNTVFVTLINTGLETEFCSEKCLNERLDDLYNGRHIFLLPYAVADRFDFKKEIISENPLSIEVTLYY